MKALTLHQPWATLVAIGAKKIETRTWKTRHRGLLAIHAGATRPRADLCRQPLFQEALQDYADYAGQVDVDLLPTGAVIAMCWLSGCTPMSLPEEAPSEPERSFGIYAPGRYMWNLGNVREVGPFPAKGRLGVWEWEEVAVTDAVCTMYLKAVFG